MNLRTISTEAEYRDTLREIETLMSADAGTADGERLKMLVYLVEAYELKNFEMAGIENARNSLRLDHILTDQSREIVELDAKGEVVILKPRRGGDDFSKAAICAADESAEKLQHGCKDKSCGSN